MAEFAPCYEKVIVLEGGYVLHQVAGDRGGMTYAGIARNSWPDWPGWLKIDAGTFDAELTGMVRAFYRKNYWDLIQGDRIESQEVAFCIYGCAVNTGMRKAVQLVQRICGATPDGVFGEKTLSALNAMIADEKDERIFVLLFALLQVFRYKDICMNDSRRGQDQLASNLKFLCGWINRVQRGIA